MTDFRRALTAILLAALVTVSGCGLDSIVGGSKDETTTGGTTTGGTTSGGGTATNPQTASDFATQFSVNSPSDTAEPLSVDNLDLSNLPQDETAFDFLFQ